jgi:Tol biopolymer transport system component
MKAPALLLLVCSLAASPSLVRAQVSGPLNAASTTPLPGATGGSGSYSPGFSADGRFLVFASRANNLVTNDSNATWLDVFVRDLASNTTTLVSVNSSGTGGGDGNSFNPVISSNGQFIAFESAASNLVPGDTNGLQDIFVRDLIAGTTTLVSVSTNGTSSGDGASRFPVITPDGRWIAFESAATNLVAGDANGLKDVFVRDLQTGTTYRASTGSATPGSGSESPSVSADGQRIAFACDAVLGISKSKSKGDIYVRDLTTATTIWASTNIYNLGTGLRSYNPTLSADGRFVAFKTEVTNPGKLNTNLYYHDLLTSVTTIVGSNVLDGTFPELTPDGRFVAYESRTNIFLWDSLTGSNTLVSVDLTGTNAASGTSFRPVLTPDGSKIAFLSDAANLTINGGNGQPQLCVRDLAAGITRLASANLSGQPSSSLSGIVPSLTADGNRVAFWSTDEHLVPDDQNKDADVFFRDLSAETTSLVSARISGLPSQTSAGLVILSGDSVSADGRFVVLSVFGSSMVSGEANMLPHIAAHDLATGTNLPVDALENPNGLPVAVSNLPFPTNFQTRLPVLSANGRFAAYLGLLTTDTQAVEQVYVRDLQSQTNWLASRAWNSSDAGSAKAFTPSISGDGTHVVFQSDATNLVPTDLNARSDVFVRDLANATNILVSVNLFGTNSGNNFSTNPVISRDGRWVVFQSRATDLVTNAFNSLYPQLFARDLLSNTTTFVSGDTNGVGLTRDSGGPLINPGSRLVLFTNYDRSVYLYDLFAQTNTLVCSNCFTPAMSADGRWIAFETLLGTNQIRDIVLLDFQTGATNLVSVNRDGTGGGNASSTKPQITYDGRYNIFASRASNLVDNDTNGWTDIFVRDRIQSTTLLVSRNRQFTGPGNSASSKPLLGADGRTVVFQSFSSDFIENDFNNGRDVFVLRLEAGDSDGDGLPDDWELAYFGTLDPDGTGDFDGDGHTDLQEFLAGTDPTNAGSVLRVLTVTSLGGNTTILWSATPGKNYQVQFKTNVTQTGWTVLPGLITATGSSASRLDNSGGAGGQRYYRVVLAP